MQTDLLLSKSIKGSFQSHDRSVTLPNTLLRAMVTCTLFPCFLQKLLALDTPL